MHNRRSLYIVTVLMLAVLALPLSMAAAQEELTETYVSEEYNLSFQYPEDWTVSEDDNVEAVILLSERIGIAFFGPDNMDENLAEFETAEELIIGAADNAGRNLNFDKSEVEEINDRELFIMPYTDRDDREGLFVTVDLSDGRPALITVTSQGTNLRGSDEATALAIIATLDYADAAEPVSRDIVFPDRLEDFDRSPSRAVGELQDAGVLPEDGEVVFEEDTFLVDESTVFTFAQEDEFTNVVMAGMVTFSAGNTDEELCSMYARLTVNEEERRVDTYLRVSFSSDGQLVVVDRFGDGEDEFNAETFTLDLDLEDAHHLMIVAAEENIRIYVDGELIVDDFQVEDVNEGFFGFGMFTERSRSECEVEEFWGYSFD